VPQVLVHPLNLDGFPDRTETTVVIECMHFNVADSITHGVLASYLEGHLSWLDSFVLGE
jgi:hypothetical protein